jgi:hypothetical protein
MTNLPGTPTPPQTTARPRKLLSVSAVSILAAAAVNLGLYAIGRAAHASLRVDPGAGPPNHLVIAPDVAWKTILPLALGALVLALVARRSRRWTTVMTALGAVVAIASGVFASLGAHDTFTGVLLFGMHTVGGIAVIVIGAQARLNVPA